jgi:hypothetical protein
VRLLKSLCRQINLALDEIDGGQACGVRTGREEVNVRELVETWSARHDDR